MVGGWAYRTCGVLASPTRQYAQRLRCCQWSASAKQSNGTGNRRSRTGGVGQEDTGGEADRRTGGGQRRQTGQGGTGHTHTHTHNAHLERGWRTGILSRTSKRNIRRAPTYTHTHTLGLYQFIGGSVGQRMGTKQSYGTSPGAYGF